MYRTNTHSLLNQCSALPRVGTGETGNRKSHYVIGIHIYIYICISVVFFGSSKMRAIESIELQCVSINHFLRRMC